jgi:hypothetical protein
MMINCLSCGKQYSVIPEEIEHDLKKCVCCDSESLMIDPKYSLTTKTVSKIEEIAVESAKFIERRVEGCLPSQSEYQDIITETIMKKLGINTS